MTAINHQNGELAWNGSNAYHHNGAVAWNGSNAYYQNGSVAWSGSDAYYVNGAVAWNGSNAFYTGGSSAVTDEIEIILGQDLKMQSGKNGFSLFVCGKRVV